MSKDSFKISEYHKGTASMAPCPRCGALVTASGTLCPECGLHFRGQASDFAPEANRVRKPHRAMKTIALLIAVGIALAAVIGLVMVLLNGSK